MKKISLYLAFTMMTAFASAQNNAPTQITPQLLQKMKAGIETSIPAFKQDLYKKEFTEDQVEFAADTFRINQLVAKRMDIDYSTAGMNITVNEMAAAYDKLLNKYYNKLLNTLNTADKKTLIAAQRAWINYRDAESKLTGTLTKTEYSGGGTIQSNIATGAYADLVTARTIALFNYYDGIVKK